MSDKPVLPLLLPLLLLPALTGCNAEPDAARQAPAADTLVLGGITRPALEGHVHQVRLAQQGDQYAFEPASLVVARGDIVRFVMVGSQPESVAFDTAGASPQIAEFLHSSGLVHGVLLTDPGDTYDVSFADAPVGIYPFRSVPHASSGMLGKIEVREP